MENLNVNKVSNSSHKKNILDHARQKSWRPEHHASTKNHIPTQSVTAFQRGSKNATCKKINPLSMKPHGHGCPVTLINRYQS